jgi:hypothetical protein
VSDNVYSESNADDDIFASSQSQAEAKVSGEVTKASSDGMEIGEDNGGLPDYLESAIERFAEERGSSEMKNFFNGQYETANPVHAALRFVREMYTWSASTMSIEMLCHGHHWQADYEAIGDRGIVNRSISSLVQGIVRIGLTKAYLAFQIKALNEHITKMDASINSVVSTSAVIYAHVIRVHQTTLEAWISDIHTQYNAFLIEGLEYIKDYETLPIVNEIYESLANVTSLEEFDAVRISLLIVDLNQRKYIPVVEAKI